MINLTPRSIFLTRLTLLFLLLGLSTTAGCTSDESSSSESLPVEAPAELLLNGKKWQKEVSINQSDQNLLSQYFQANPSLIDSPDLHGTPDVYHGAQNKRRFYWVHPMAERTRWICLEYQNGGFELLEGEGNPYQIAK